MSENESDKSNTFSPRKVVNDNTSKKAEAEDDFDPLKEVRYHRFNNK